MKLLEYYYEPMRMCVEPSRYSLQLNADLINTSMLFCTTLYEVGLWKIKRNPLCCVYDVLQHSSKRFHIAILLLAR